jgi:hypothetical protein
MAGGLPRYASLTRILVRTRGISSEMRQIFRTWILRRFHDNLIANECYDFQAVPTNAAEGP